MDKPISPPPTISEKGLRFHAAATSYRASNRHVADGLSHNVNNIKTDHFAVNFKTSDSILEKEIVVLKIGSSSITDSNGRICIANLSRLVELVCDLKRDNYHVILTSSGAVSMGCIQLGCEKPKDVVRKQACSAVGQQHLMSLYHSLFHTQQQTIAQVLLTKDNISQEHHYLNALNTLTALLDMGVVPIINQNDAVAIQEQQLGDNDNLSALVAAIVRAKHLFLLTDVDALYTSNPRIDPTAKPIRVVHNMDELFKMGVNTEGNDDNSSGKWGTGGMATKLDAAKIATAAGCFTYIVHSDRLDDVRALVSGSLEVGTTFNPCEKTLSGRKKWIALGLVPVGSIIVDSTCAFALMHKASLFHAGIRRIEGGFPSNAAVKIVNLDGVEIGRGITNYSSGELDRLKGMHSDQIQEILGYQGPAAACDRSNIAMMPSSTLTPSSSETNLIRRMQRSGSSSTFSDIPSPEQLLLGSGDMMLKSPSQRSVCGEDYVSISSDVDSVAVSERLGYDVEIYGSPEVDSDGAEDGAI